MSGACPTPFANIGELGERGTASALGVLATRCMMGGVRNGGIEKWRERLAMRPSVNMRQGVGREPGRRTADVERGPVMRRYFVLLILLSVVLVGLARTEEFTELWIDDLTWVQGGRVVMLSAPLVEGLSEGSVGDATKAGGSRALRNGYAVCSTSDDAYAFDGSSHIPGAAIPMPGATSYPYDATMNSTGLEVWIADASDDSVVVVDVATDTVAHTIPVGDYPVSVAFSKDGTFALGVCRDDSVGVDNMFRISTSTYAVTGSWIAPLDFLGPGKIALDGVSGKFYMVQWYDNYLHEVAADGASVLRTASLGASLWQLVVDPDGSVIYVTDRGTDDVRVIDRVTLTQLSAVSVCDDPWGIDITPDGAKLYVACEDSHDVWVIDTATWSTAVISVGAGDPRDVSVSADGAKAFVAGGDSGSPDLVYVIDIATDTLLSPVSLPAGASNTNVVAAPVALSLIFADGFESGDFTAWSENA